MQRIEHGLGTITMWLAVCGIALIAALVLTMGLLEMRFNPGGAVVLAALSVTYVAMRFFSRRHLTERSVASLFGLILSVIGQLCIVALTITSVGLLLLPAAVLSIGLLIVALANQISSAQSTSTPA